MEAEVLRLYKESLFCRLKERVKAYVDIQINGCVMVIIIKNEKLYFGYNCTNAFDYIMEHPDSTDLANDIVKSYKTYIHKQYFR